MTSGHKLEECKRKKTDNEFRSRSNSILSEKPVRPNPLAGLLGCFFSSIDVDRVFLFCFTE
jgi:hypothetical protein